MREAVKKALTAGVQAFQQMNGSDPDYNDTPEIGAAIAAFLRALPVPDNNSGGWSCHLVADAVERAAGDEVSGR